MKLKFRAWDKKEKVMDNHFWISADGDPYDMPTVSYNTPHTEIESTDDLIVMQYIDAKDINNTCICSGDLLNVFFTSGNGKHIHDCIYEVRINALGVELRLVNLFWEHHGYNQYPLQYTLSANHGSLCAQIDGSGNVVFCTPNNKELDSSFYFEVIGNIYENGELLNDN